MQTVPVGIIGASGYSGLELSRILALHHPHVEIKLLGSDKWAGESAARRAGLPGAAGKLKYAPQDRSAELARECAAVFLATPAEASLQLAPALLDAAVRVIDLSGAFRLRDVAFYPKFYGFAHPRPDLLAKAFYGLPELHRTPKGAALVANPGCYPTAAALALAPLIEAGALDGSQLIVDAASGVTGAGRRAAEDYSFAEIDGDFRAYKVLRHQHQPEIAQMLGRSLTFTPHLLPTRRGILATCYARLAADRGASDLTGAYAHKYAGAPFVEVLESPDAVTLKGVTGTNKCQVAVAAEGDVVVAISAIDNLVKGAAGQAVQNLNLMMGWPETAGLDTLRGFHP
ncbi:MAG: N-acetyl-gamma-glutamyl-phosphate reductase [Deltaproteobacteria bacterium]|nr:MAG: N-acetyl-gamma-glutamyl-phosphate reductase [Deltaproteobacteria bacterium]